MNDLKNGKLNIDSIIITKETKLQNFIDNNIENLEISKLEDNRSVVRFQNGAKIGGKLFSVRISFLFDRIKSINLKRIDPDRNEWDYKALIRQHGDWLEEHIGYPGCSLPGVDISLGKSLSMV